MRLIDHNLAVNNIRPDGYFMLGTKEHFFRCLIEIDRSSEDNPRFFREKILPGLAYIKSRKHEQRFVHRRGRWLVVTTGERSLKNMLRQTRRGEAKGLFYFTTYGQLSVGTIFHEPIWRREDKDNPVPLIF